MVIAAEALDSRVVAKSVVGSEKTKGFHMLLYRLFHSSNSGHRKSQLNVVTHCALEIGNGRYWKACHFTMSSSSFCSVLGKCSAMGIKV